MGVQFGLGIASTGIAALAIAGISWIGGNRALDKPMVGDGIGGKDTDNLTTGCFGLAAGMILAMYGAVATVVGLLIALVSYLTSK